MALKLNRLGWTQEEIGDKVGLSQNRISEIVGKFSVKEIDNAFKEGKSVEEIAELYEDGHTSRRLRISSV